MLIDLIAVQPPLLLAGAVAVYAATVLHLVARNIERARWQRQFGGWRALQRDRVDRTVQPIPFLRTLLAARRHHLRPCGSSWRAVQRHRIDRAADW